MRCVIRWYWRRVSTCNTITLASLQHDVIHAGGVGDDSLKCGGTSREEEGEGAGDEAKSSKVAKTDMVRFATLSGRESGKIVEKSGPNSIRWLPKMCRFAVSRYLHNSNSWPSLAHSNSAELSFRRLLEGDFDFDFGNLKEHLRSARSTPLRVVFLALLSCSFKFPCALNLHKARWRVL